MSSRPLHHCPTCKRELDAETRQNMGLRNGEALNALCPGLNGPSDIDHVLHNGHVEPQRAVFLEYKAPGAAMTGGQAWTMRALRGDWVDINDGRRLLIAFHVLADDDVGPLADIVAWVWPPKEAAA